MADDAAPDPFADHGPRDAVAWGLVGALSFGVLHQAYLFLGGRFLGIAPVLGVALAVGVAAGVGSHLLAGRLAERNEQR